MKHIADPTIKKKPPVFLTKSLCVVSSGDAVWQLSCCSPCPLTSRKWECAAAQVTLFWRLGFCSKAAGVSAFASDEGAGGEQLFFNPLRHLPTCLSTSRRLNSLSKLLVMDARRQCTAKSCLSGGRLPSWHSGE